MIIKLTKNTPTFKKNSARANWFTAIKRYDGKSVENFLAAAAKKPPVRKRDGTGESPMGWLRYFERNENIQIS